MIRAFGPHPFGAAVAMRRRCLPPAVLGSNRRLLTKTALTTNIKWPKMGHFIFGGEGGIQTPLFLLAYSRVFSFVPSSVPTQILVQSSAMAAGTLWIDPAGLTGIPDSPAGCVQVHQQHIVDAGKCSCNTCPDRLRCQAECRSYRKYVKNGRI
jgi:hypothetical protein